MRNQRILNAEFKIVIARFCIMIVESFGLFVMREVAEQVNDFMFYWFDASIFDEAEIWLSWNDFDNDFFDVLNFSTQTEFKLR